MYLSSFGIFDMMVLVQILTLVTLEQLLVKSLQLPVSRVKGERAVHVTIVSGAEPALRSDEWPPLHSTL